MEGCQHLIKKHDKCECHLEAVDIIIAIPESTRSILKQLSQQHADQEKRTGTLCHAYSWLSAFLVDKVLL